MKNLIKKLLFSALVFVFSFVLIEGASSGLILARRVGGSLLMHHPNFLRYDKDLGWANIPNYYDKNCFGPGIYLHADARGFRGNEEITDKIPPGKVRLLCSGDSLTLGYGVDNDHTWCQELESMNNALQTVNMGQSGYGVDQMYLWYRRDGMPLQHDVQVLAVIGYDFGRMELTSMIGYPKPILKLGSDGLVADNVPVPKRLSYVRWWIEYGQAFKELKTIQLAGAVLSRISPPRPPSEPTPAIAQIVSKLIDELQSLNNNKNSVLVLVYLPLENDYNQNDRSLPKWRALLHQEAARTGLPLIDLTDDFQKLSPQQLRRLFIQGGPSLTPYVAGHYSNEGNEFVAQKLYRYLLALPEIQEKLAERQPTAATRSH